MDIRVIATIAAKSASYFVILAHNHPTGDLTPSKADIAGTKNVTKGLKLINTQVLDHIIFSDTEYLSMRDSGYM
jgi:DNA repair protein RadC